MCREDATGDLVDELRFALGPGSGVVALEPGLVRSMGAPTFEDGAIDVTFARQGASLLARHPRDVSFETLLQSVSAALDAARAFDLHVVAPDSDEGNRRAKECAELEARILGALPDSLRARRVPSTGPMAGEGVLVSAVVSSDAVLLGACPIADAISRFPGGRARMRVGSDRPSRAARKLDEALAWLGLSPGPGERCVDLGAAPGGWSWALLGRRAHVVAVDPAALRPDVASHRNLRHVRTSAFSFAPDEPVDWLFCDMAWRPLEVAELLAKWGRRRWARMLVANLKLPMRSKAAIVEELRAILRGGGWSHLRSRQLYHDRDEVTVTARLAR